MDSVQILVLALLQGLTEFLPVSSSAHLILLPHLLGWEDQGIRFDVAVHLGTLIAVVVYFRAQLMAIAKSVLVKEVEQRRLLGHLFVATLPVVIVGGLAHDFIALHLRAPEIIIASTFIFGLVLLAANYPHANARNEYQITLKTALIIGLSQVLALIPGVSRAGITITAGVLLGMSRSGATHFSFLMAIPVITGSALLELLLIWKDKIPVDWFGLSQGVLVSAISAYVCIHYFLKLIEQMGFTPFVIYRVFLAVVLFVIMM